MEIMYNGNTIKINDNLKKGATTYDTFPNNVNLEDTIEFDSNIFLDKINNTNINLDKTIKLGDDTNE